MKGLLIFCLFIVVHAQLQEALIKYTHDYEADLQQRIPPYPSMLPLIPVIENKLVETAKEGHYCYEFELKMDYTFDLAGSSYNHAVKNWNEQIERNKYRLGANHLIYDRFIKAIDDLMTEWNEKHADVIMQRQKSKTTIKVCWSDL